MCVPDPAPRDPICAPASERQSMSSSFARNAIVLGALTAVGPFAIDMYLPALPAIAEGLNTTTGATQATLTAFFGAVAIFQIVYGPLSDAFGRKAPLYFGLGLYSIASIGCALSTSIEMLIGFRVLQGIGACAGMSIPRAIVRDLHTGPDAARLMALVMLVFSVAPLLAPLAGSLMIAVIGWRSIFWVLTLIGLFALACNFFFLTETRKPEARIRSSLDVVLRNYLNLFRDRNFLAIVFVGAFGLASFFTFLATSSFVYIGHFGLTPTQYSLAFSVNAFAFIGMAQFAGRLGRRYGLVGVVNWALIAYAALTLLAVAVTLAGIDSLPLLMGLLFLGFGAMGLVIPSTSVLALENYGPTAGTAAALMGTLQFVTGAVGVSIVSPFADGSPLPMVAAIACCAVLALVFGRITLARHRSAL